MIPRRPVPSLAPPLALGALWSLLALAACSTPAPAPLAVAAPKPPPAPVQEAAAPPVTMAPIPNPPEHGPSHAERSRDERRLASRAPEPSAPQKSPVDPRRAARLRVAGLVQLNRGSIKASVRLLRQASDLDPGSVLIKRDLERALRIEVAVGSKN